MSTPLFLLIGLTIATCVIAYWSDNLGKKLGKKRVTLLGLRPRQTATLMTMTSSVVIMLFTFGVLLATNSGLRGALSAALRAYFEVLDSYSLQDLVEKPAALSRALGADNTQLVPSVPIKRVSRKARTTPSVPGESGRT